MSSCYAPPSGRTESYFQAGAVFLFVFGVFVAVLGFVLGSFVFPEYINSILQSRLSLWNPDSVGRQNFVRGLPSMTSARSLRFRTPSPQPPCQQLGGTDLYNLSNPCNLP